MRPAHCLLVAGVLPLLAACAPDPTDTRNAVAPAPSFVGGAACASCHPSQTERWRRSHHARSMQPAGADTVLGDFDDQRFDYAPDKFIEFFRRDGRYWVRTNDPAAAEPAGAVAEYEVLYTFGFDPLQQYLVALDRGRLQALNVAWDSRAPAVGGARWFDLYAGEQLALDDPLHWGSELHTWNGRCAFCHSTRVEKRYDSASSTFDTQWTSVNVDCEACHGPGATHVADPSAPLSLGVPVRAQWALGPEPIAAPERIPQDHDLELDTCAPCHARRAQHADPRIGAEFLDAFLPARIDDPLYFVDGQIEDEVFVYGSFLQSAMHAAGVTCTDCHDPHAGTVRADGDSLCSSCHRADVFGTPAHNHHEAARLVPRCVDCHMPARTYMRVDPRRDHSLRVPRPDLSVALGVPNACSDCHAERTAEWAAARVAEWFPDGRATRPHYALDLAAGRRWSASRSAQLARLVGDAASPAIVRATALGMLGQQLDGAALDVIAAALADPEPLLNVAALDALAAADPPLKVRLGQRFLDAPLLSVRIAAVRALGDAREALSPARQADLDAALAEYEHVLEYNGETAEARHGLGLLRERRGDVAAAEQLYRAAIEANTSYAPAYVNLADLYRRGGREADGNALLEGAVAGALRDSAAVHFALGLSHVRLGARAAAQSELERAIELDPADPYLAYVGALSRDLPDDHAATLRALQTAHERFPGYAPILFALATMHRDIGDLDAALGYAERLLSVSPGNASGVALRAELGAAR